MTINACEGIELASTVERLSIISLPRTSFHASTSSVLRAIRKDLFSRRRTAPAILQLIPEVTVPDRFNNASFWAPSYVHWTIPNPTRESNAVPIPIVKDLLDQLHPLWHTLKHITISL
ncbi:hypothetical protein G6F70_003930 [Rhizopus microsporus]|nr:hypothetical protein G6F71_003968 [Rhizopus microsporus]KAG1200567.1 hypothetical protein G6F70_003930 [Rhizopus microsporus]KAG1212343.1 hypothetical protein G6F69_003776 [Rhizopus microsporus]KAG1234338.1 hypothetical protein G6F67_003588 [Rhizopus microsporus]KAG1264849.1 hypothetical protein G6F68_004040 [Rhizopus microsporus]